MEYRDAAARLGRQLEEQLEQLEVDLIAGERRRRAEARMRLDEKQAARARLPRPGIAGRQKGGGPDGTWYMLPCVCKAYK